MKSDLERVKSILLGSEYAELLALKDEFENSEAFTRAIANVIAEALEERAARDDRVSDVLAPTIDQAIAGSIDQDPKKLAESLYPIMGPAIRKSISETLQQMLENFNQLLEQSFSPKSLMWRFDAWRTGRSYSELVLLNTLEYEVEQVFLIHKETSLLLQHVYSDLSEMKDPDMVSSMFSAIQDFIQDSFTIGEMDTLDTLRLGELNVVLQDGPQAILAVVVRGNPPEHLRSSMQQLSETLHRTKKAKLQDFSRDPMDFADISEDMRSILEIKQKQEVTERKIPWLALLAITVAAIASGYYYHLENIKQAGRADLLARFDQQPGIVLLESGYRDELLQITALVDPLIDAQSWLQANSSTAFSLQPYPFLSAEDEVLLIRATGLLKPGPDTALTVTDGELILSGEATAAWLNQVAPLLIAIPGIQRTNTEALNVRNLKLERLEAITQRVSAYTYNFEKESYDINPEAPQIQRLASALREALTLRQAEKLPPAMIHVVGYTDDSGSAGLNRRVGTSRAERLRAILIEQGLPPGQLVAIYGEDYERMPVLNNREVRVYIVEPDEL